MRKGIGGHQSAKMKNDEWLTPLHLLRPLGTFDLDPCAPIVRPWDTARHHYTKEDDGLKKEWFGRVWLNPPYSIKFKFIHLANHRYITGQIKNCFMLLTLNTLACHASKCLDQYPVCIHRGRLNFVPLSGQDETQNTVNSAFVYLGEDVKKFELIFSKYGRIC